MPSRDIKDCVQELQDKWNEIQDDFEKEWQGYHLVLTCTHRPPEEQMELFKKGREFNSMKDQWEIVDVSQVVTYKDGTKYPSRHNLYPSEAIDVAVITPVGTTTWDTKYYQCLIGIAQTLGLESGGSWKNFKDWPHIQTLNT